MKTKIVLFVLLFPFFIYAQSEQKNDTVKVETPKTASVTIGILQGGGSLLGVDIEKMLFKQMGLQAGLGIYGFGAGINYHFKPSIRSSFLSLQYWHQGFGNSYTQSVIGPSIIFRGKQWFTAQIGLAYVLEYGPAWPSNIQKSPVILTYAIGGYIPF